MVWHIFWPVRRIRSRHLRRFCVNRIYITDGGAVIKLVEGSYARSRSGFPSELCSLLTWPIDVGAIVGLSYLSMQRTAIRAKSSRMIPFLLLWFLKVTWSTWKLSQLLEEIKGLLGRRRCNFVQLWFLGKMAIILAFIFSGTGFKIK